MTAPLFEEMVVDNFAGGGGASAGIEAALGRPIDIAINHDPEAIAMHQANHPKTRHFCEDVFDVDPVAATAGRPVGLAWFSPDCKHFSKAKGGKPVNKNIRSLAWVVVKWARLVKPRIIMLENVEEFQDWGPLTEDNRPCPKQRGLTFRRWVRELERCGYQVETRELKACDYGAPTIRKRLFVIARCDGQPIVWPRPTHGKRRRPYRAAAECIDWTVPCPSIFLSKEQARGLGVRRPLAEATMRRIANGIRRYVIEAKQPFIVAVNDELVVPSLINTRNGERPGQEPRTRDIRRPYATVTAQGSQGALVAAFLAKHFGGNETPGWPLQRAMSTVTARDHHALVTAFMLKYYGTDQNPRLEKPIHTVRTKDCFGIVTVEGRDYQIADVGMRMLQPRELFAAQGFPPDYVIDAECDGKPLSKTAQVRMCGNSVCPPLSEALVAANYVQQQRERATA